MTPAILPTRTDQWLLENGPQELKSLFSAIVFHPSAPILIADSDRQYRDASVGAEKLLGLPREQIVGRSLDDFVEPTLQSRVSEMWQSLLEKGEQTGTLKLVRPDGTPREVDFIAKGNVLPSGHLLVLRDRTARAKATPESAIPGWVQDYALSLLTPEGKVAAWYSGAERIFGYTNAEALGKPVGWLYPDDTPRLALRAELNRA
ncbi:MAG: PAS domain-containing protein, partial [Acidobacteriota bacterium]